MNTETPPLLSIVIPTYNCETTIGACISSITRQSYPNIEILVIDAESTDDTVGVIRRLSPARCVVRIVSEPDQGIYDAINKGMKMARGDWLYVIGADDKLFADNVIENVSRHFTEQNEYLYGKILHEHRNAIEGGPVDRQTLLTKGIYHQATFYRRSLVSRIGSYNLRYKICADWDYSLRCFGANAKIRFIDVTVARYSGTGTSSRSRDHAFDIDKLKIASKQYEESLFGRFFTPHRFTFHSQSMLCRSHGRGVESTACYLFYLYHSALARLSGRRGTAP